MQPTKPSPPDWPRISSSIFYDDAAAAIDWLCAAFGFEVRLRIEGEGGRIEHSELDYGEGMIMVGSTHRGADDAVPLRRASPRSVDGVNTQALCIVVDDADAHCEHARAQGAVIAMEPATQDYGEEYWSDRSYRAVDPEGHHWFFMQRLSYRGKPLE